MLFSDNDSDSSVKIFRELIQNLLEQGYKLVTFPYTDIYEWGIRSYGLRMYKNNIPAFPTVELNNIEYDIVKEITKEFYKDSV